MRHARGKWPDGPRLFGSFKPSSKPKCRKGCWCKAGCPGSRRIRSGCLTRLAFSRFLPGWMRRENWTHPRPERSIWNKSSGQVDDPRLPLLKIPEAELVVEIEEDPKLVPGPSGAGWRGHWGEDKTQGGKTQDLKTQDARGGAPDCRALSRCPWSLV